MYKRQADPTRVHIGELDNTKNEPLAIKLRYMMRKKGVCIF
jgi:tRNA A37 threonylcarbamoyladenosine dehydratase